jgi:thiol-disulfide isomerase/thioredoxin
MKKLTLILACATLLFACARNRTATITGSLEGLKDGTKITLVLGAMHVQQNPVAETTVINGTFQFNIPLEEPRLFVLTAEDVRGVVRIMAEPGDRINVVGTFQEPVITGSKMHELYVEKFVNPRAEMDRRHAESRVNADPLMQQAQEARERGDTATASRLNAEANAFSREFFAFMGEKMDRIIEENANTFWGPLLLLSHTAFLTPNNERHWNMFSDEVKASFYGRAVSVALFGIVGPGQEAPNFEAKDASGNVHSLKTILENGNYVLLDFWATWCGPCIQIAPYYEALAKKYIGKDIVFLSVSIEKSREDWANYLSGKTKVGPHMLMTQESHKENLWRIGGVPRFVVIDKDFNIVNPFAPRPTDESIEAILNALL